MADDWQYLAGRLVGDGSIEIIESELPLDVQTIQRNMSAPSQITGTINERIQRLKANGRPVFEPWNTVIIAVASDVIRGMAIYKAPEFAGPAWTLNTIGMSGYPIGMPYDGERQDIGEDPLNIFRHIWEHLQSQPGGNIGVTVDQLTSEVRVGTPEKDVDFTTSDGKEVSFEAGPRKLNWYTTFDLGRVIDDYASSTPFDWLETYSWDTDGQPHCHIKLGYPIIGSRNENMRIVYGENTGAIPSVTTGEFANQVWTLGSGEGRDRIRGYAGIADGKIRRIKVVENKSWTNKSDADAGAGKALRNARGDFIVEDVVVHATRDRPLEGYELGAEVPLVASLDWVDLDTTARIVGRSDSPGKSDTVTLTLVREAVL